MKLKKIRREVTSLPDGTYIGTINRIFPFIKNETQWFSIVFNMDDGKNTEFTYFATVDNLERYPWSAVFNALDTNDTDDLVDHKCEFIIKNNAKNGKIYCNIAKITVK